MRTLVPIVLSLSVLAGCFSRPSVPAVPGAAAGSVPHPGDPSILGLVAAWAGGLAAFALIGAIILIATGRRKLGGDIAIAAGAVIVAMPILQWADRNLWWIATLVGIGVASIAGMAAWHRLVPKIEKLIGIDINRDGQIGPTTKKESKS